MTKMPDEKFSFKRPSPLDLFSKLGRNIKSVLGADYRDRTFIKPISTVATARLSKSTHSLLKSQSYKIINYSHNSESSFSHKPNADSIALYDLVFWIHILSNGVNSLCFLVLHKRLRPDAVWPLSTYCPKGRPSWQKCPMKNSVSNAPAR